VFAGQPPQPRVHGEVAGAEFEVLAPGTAPP
jgi:hypothetical protein